MNPKLTHEKPELTITPIGGLDQFGLNMTVYQCSSDAIIVDAGSMISPNQDYGIGVEIPNINDSFVHSVKPLCYVVTHGHEDHVGALPFLYEANPAPIVATPWTAEIILNRFNKWQKNPPDMIRDERGHP